MSPSLVERLSHAEEQFLQAAVEGGASLTTFHDLWSTLVSDIEGAAQAGHIDTETVALRDSVAPRVAILSDYLLDFQTTVQSMSSTLHGELEEIFARVDINDIHPTAESNYTAPHHDFPSQSLGKTPHPPYIASAYDWLLRNLHNPYPSKETRDAIAANTSSDRKVIDAWFIDTRKRIGWNSLRRKKFSNKRIKIVEAARRCFGENDPQCPLHEPLRFDFLAIEMRARELYAEKFSESVLVTKLDAALMDMTPEMKAQAQIEERGRRQQAKVQERDALAASFYPSPHRSPSGTPEPLLPSDELDLSIVPPMTIASRKRSISFRGSPELDSELSHDRPSKRSRLDIPSGVDASVANLPSPAPSFSEPLPPIDECGSVNISCTLSSSAPVGRKRRLSDAGSQGTIKRPRNILSGPRLHSVSDPLPSSTTLSAWFESHFGIPSAVTADEPNLSLPFDVELYDYSNVALGLKPLPAVVGASNIIHPQQNITPLSSFETPIPSLNVSTNNFDYNELFCDLEDTSSEPFTQDTLNQSDELPFEPPSFDFNIPQTSFEKLNTIPDTVVIADSSVPAVQNPESSFDWMFPPLLLSEGTYDTVADTGFHQDSIFGFLPPEMSFHPTDLPCSNIAIAHMSAGADKVAKQRELMEMKEATRRLEAEIAAS